MKSFFTTILLLLLNSSFVKAQLYNPLLKANTFWDIMISSGSEICYLESGGRYFLLGDTILLGNTYSIIREFPIVPINNPGPYCPPFIVNPSTSIISGFIREDTITQQVFVYDQSNDTDALLYDFNLTDGDTLNSVYAGQGASIIIDSVRTTTLLNGDLRKIFYYSDTWGNTCNQFQYYIEGIGSQVGLHFPLVYISCGPDGGLTCVKSNDIQLYGGQCVGTVGLKEEKIDEQLEIYPNPFNNYFSVKSELNVEFDYKIYSIDGVLIQENKSFTNNKIPISLKKGIYFLEVLNSDKKIHKIEKLIKLI